MGSFKLFLGAATLLLSLVVADWQHRSRLDLSPSKLNITVPATSSEKGCPFIAPYPGHKGEGPVQPGVYIFRDNGDLVWSGVGYFVGWVAHFRTASWKNEPVLYAFQGELDALHERMYGNHAILNNDYETVKIVKAAHRKLLSTHEFRVVGDKSIPIEVPVPLPVDLSPWGGDEGQWWIVSNGFQEIDTETGQLIFEWYSFDHADKIDPKCWQASISCFNGIPLTPSP